MSMLSTFKTSGRAALVALTLGASTLVAMPVQAASEPSFSFQLGIGDGGNVMSFGVGKQRKGFHPIKQCLTNRQVERGLEHYGFDDVDVIKNLTKSRVLVIAEWHRKDYSLKVNKCSGEVYDIQRLRKGNGNGNGHWDDNNGHWNNDGHNHGNDDSFGFQFNF